MEIDIRLMNKAPLWRGFIFLLIGNYVRGVC